MSEGNASAAPKWLFVIGLLAFVWNLMGVAAYIMQVNMTPEDLAALPEAHRAMIDATPAWATGAFAVAVFGGALGSLFLMLRNSFAVPLLALSLAGVLVQMYHAFVVADSIAVFGPGGMIMPILVIVIAIFLLSLARTARVKGWLS